MDHVHAPSSGLARWIGHLVVLGLLACGVWYFANKMRVDLSARMLAKAEFFLGLDRQNDAALCLKSTVRLDPANLVAWHKLASLRADAGDTPGAMDALSKMIQEAAARNMTARLPQILSSIRDQRMVMSVSLKEQDQLFDMAADGLAGMAGNKGLAYLMAADSLSAAGQTNVAVQKLVQGSNEIRIFTAPWKLSDLMNGRTSSPIDATDYIEVLSDMEKRLGPRGYEAVYFGLKTGLVPSSRMLKWARRLADDPAATVPMRLHAAGLVSCLSGAPMSVDFLHPENPAELSEQDRRLLGVEFLRTGFPEKTLLLVDRVQALKSQSLFKLRLAALRATNRRAEALEALGKPTNPLSTNDTTLETFKLQSAFEPDGRVSSGVKLTPIHPKNAAELMAYANFLVETRQDDRLAGLIRGLPKGSREAESLPKTVLAKARERGDLRAAIVLQNATLEAQKPERAVEVFSDREIFSALAGSPVDLAGLEALRGEKPDSIPLRISHAFALLSSGQTEAAVEALRAAASQIDVHALKTHQKVAVAVILFANGLSAPALEVAKLALFEKLFPAEVEKLAPVFRQAADPS